MIADRLLNALSVAICFATCGLQFMFIVDTTYMCQVCFPTKADLFVFGLYVADCHVKTANHA